MNSSYNRFATVAARALRNSLNEKERQLATRRGECGLKYAQFENGQAGPFVSLNFNQLI